MNNLLKKQKGITLIALIITVVIMLILAGVAISVLTGDGGLFERTRNAAEAYEQASQNEADKIQSLMNDIDVYLNGIPSGGTDPLPIAETVSVGDYVNYNAETWTQADLNKITASEGSPTLHSSVNDATTGNQTLPDTQGQFGGFEIGQSRDSNSTEYSSSWKPRTAGWRVWDIDESTGVVTLISAGHPETYYHVSGNSSASVNILRNRDCSMYVNSFATSAKILTGQEAARWYNKQYGTNYTIVENGGSSSTFYGKTFSTDEPISVLENGSYYWLASADSSNDLYLVFTRERGVYRGSNDGCRGACSSFSKI